MKNVAMEILLQSASSREELIAVAARMPSPEHHAQHLIDLVGDGLDLGLGGRVGDGQRQLGDAVGVLRRVIHLLLPSPASPSIDSAPVPGSGTWKSAE